MKRIKEKEEKEQKDLSPEQKDDLDNFIRRKNIQNKVLKELIEKIKNTK